MLSFSIVLLSLFAGQRTDIELLCEKHQQAQSLIQTMTLEVEHVQSTDGGTTWKPMAKVKWVKDGIHERFWSKEFLSSGPKPLGTSVRFGDRYYGAQKTHELNGWDPDNPPSLPLKPGDKGYALVKGRISTRLPATGLEGPPLWLFFVASPLNSLSDLAQRSGRKTLLGKVDDQGKELWAMEFEDPIQHFSYTIYRDPNKNFAISKRVVNSGEETGAHTALEHKEVKPGIHIPIRVRNTASKHPLILNEFRVTSLQVNEPIAAESFDLRFPPGALVTDHETGKAYIWGESGPELTFANSEERAAWEVGEAHKSAGLRHSKFVIWTIVLIVIATVLLGWKLYLRKTKPV